MNRVPSLLAVALLISRVQAFAADPNFWIFLCFGQSNMEGFPGIPEQAKAGVNERWETG
ncbi:MAG TPA: sialate O-acetylesterase, partial [Verrucomicrobiales bacterium]|nr:sialate O-acetylesterase [Verrucomicrobiales bacterium]